MSALIVVYGENGAKIRQCDARCYNAKHEKCVCCCGGKNHGVGLDKAIDNTREMVEELLVKPEYRIGSNVLQPKLF